MSSRTITSFFVAFITSVVPGSGCLDFDPFSTIRAGYADDCSRVAILWKEKSPGGTLVQSEYLCATIQAELSPDPELLTACEFELAPPPRCWGPDGSDSDSEVGSEVSLDGDSGGPDTETEVGAETDGPPLCSEDCDELDTLCQDFSCVGGTCVASYTAALCDDGDSCTYGDICADGSCAGNSYDCTTEVDCEESACDGAGGCSEAVTKAGWCVTEAGCVAVGQPILPTFPCSVCTGTGTVEAANDGSTCEALASNGCSTGICAGGLCDATIPKADGTSCELPGADCVESASCMGGECAPVGTSNGSCVVGGACVADQAMVDECTKCAAGSVVDADGVACDDGDACTLGEVCSGGACVSPAPMDCDDSNACTADACDPATGTCGHTNEPEATVCDDQNPCTLSSSCDLFASCEPTLPVLQASLDYGVVVHGSGSVGYIGGGIRVDGTQVFAITSLGSVTYVVTPSATEPLTHTANVLGHIGRVINSAGDVESVRTFHGVLLAEVAVLDTNTFVSGINASEAAVDIGGPSIPFPINQNEKFLGKYDGTGEPLWLYKTEGGGMGAMQADTDSLHAVIAGAETTLTPHSGAPTVLDAETLQAALHFVSFDQLTGAVQTQVVLGTGPSLIPRVETTGKIVAMSVSESWTVAPGSALEQDLTGPVTVVVGLGSGISWTQVLSGPLVSIEPTSLGVIVAHGTSVSRIASNGTLTATEALLAGVTHVAEWSDMILGISSDRLSSFPWAGAASAEVALGNVPMPSFGFTGTVFGNYWVGGGNWGTGLKTFGPGGVGVAQTVPGNIATLIYRLDLGGPGSALCAPK